MFQKFQLSFTGSKSKTFHGKNNQQAKLLVRQSTQIPASGPSSSLSSAIPPVSARTGFGHYNESILESPGRNKNNRKFEGTIKEYDIWWKKSGQNQQQQQHRPNQTLSQNSTMIGQSIKRPVERQTNRHRTLNNTPDALPMQTNFQRLEPLPEIETTSELDPGACEAATLYHNVPENTMLHSLTHSQLSTPAQAMVN